MASVVNRATRPDLVIGDSLSGRTTWVGDEKEEKI